MLGSVTIDVIVFELWWFYPTVVEAKRRKQMHSGIHANPRLSVPIHSKKSVIYASQLKLQVLLISARCQESLEDEGNRSILEQTTR